MHCLHLGIPSVGRSVLRSARRSHWRWFAQDSAIVVRRDRLAQPPPPGTTGPGPGSVGAILAESQDFDEAFGAESDEDTSDAAPSSTPRDASNTGRGRDAVPDPLAGLQGGPGEGDYDDEHDELDEDPDHDLEFDEHPSKTEKRTH